MKQKYSKTIFIKNVKILLKYDWEPEIEITLTNGKKFLVIAYRNFIDVVDACGSSIRINSIKEIFDKFEWKQIKSIKELDGFDFSIPIEKQSVIIDGKLLLNSVK